MTFRRALAAALCAVAIGPAAVAVGAAPQPPVNISRGQLALRGYDAVAYWTHERAEPGSRNFEYRWNGAVWRFASAANRDRFVAAPTRYAPEFGGYCAYAVSRGYTADGDPTVWRLVNYSRHARTLWEQDIAGNIAKGHRNWPGVLER